MADKISKMMPKCFQHLPTSMPKLIEIQCLNWYRSNDGNHNKLYFYDVYKHVNALKWLYLLKVLQVACANGQGINKNSKDDTQIHTNINEKYMQNLCRYWRSNDTMSASSLASSGIDARTSQCPPVALRAQVSITKRHPSVALQTQVLILKRRYVHQ